MEKVAVGALKALDCSGGGIRIDGSSQGSAIITTGEASWLVCGVAGSAEDMPGPVLAMRIAHRTTVDSAVADFRQFFILSSLESKACGYVIARDSRLPPRVRH